MRAAAVLLAVILGAAVPERAEPFQALTCKDWQRLPLEQQTVYVRGIVEGIGLATLTSAMALLSEAPLDEQLALAAELAAALVAAERVRTYVTTMTAICRDPALPKETPLGFVFLAATDMLKAPASSSSAWLGLAPGIGQDLGRGFVPGSSPGLAPGPVPGFALQPTPGIATGAGR